METIVRGSRKPDLEIVCEGTGANWAAVVASDVRCIGYEGGAVVFDSPPTAVTVLTGGSGITVRRVWGVAETAAVGRMWIEVHVSFGAGFPQIFPADGPMRLDIVPGAVGT